MNKLNNVGVRTWTGSGWALSVMTLALCAALAAGSAPVCAQTPDTAGQETALRTVAGVTAPPSAQDANIASMVATLQKQITEQQAMLQVLQKKLTSPDAVLAPAPVPVGDASPTPPITAATPASPISGPAPVPASEPAVNNVPAPAAGVVPSDTSPSTPGVSAPAAGSLTTEAQRQAYASGVTVWREIENSIASQRGLGIELDEHYVMDGLRDMSAHRPLQMSPDDITRAMNNLNGDYVQRVREVTARQEETGKAYRIAFGKRKGSYSDAGAWYNIADKGLGRHLRTTDLVVLSVVGRLPDGTVFDGSGLQGQTKIAKVGTLLPAVAIGLQRVGPGGHLTVVIPPAKGYGDVGMPPSIPGGATLIFDITVKGLSGTP